MENKGDDILHFDKTKKIIILLIAVILWMILIFYLSSMNGKESTGKSRKIIEVTINKVLNITGSKIDIKNKRKLIKNLDYPVRKLSHFMEYFILTFLIYNILKLLNIKKNIYKISLLLCFIYALSDEFHQIFTNRTNSFKDVLIDTSGGLLVLLIIYKKTKNNYISE